MVDFEWDDAALPLRITAPSWVRDHPLTLRVRLLAGQHRDISFDGTPITISFEERP